MKRYSQNQLDYQALAQFRYEIRRIQNLSEQAARAAGVEPQQYQALLAIKGMADTGEATVGVLAERLQIQHHSAVELADRLESHGLLSRVRSRDDRRKVFLHLTLRGERILRRIALPHRAKLRSSAQSLLEALRAVLKRGQKPGTRPAVAEHARGLA